MPFSFKKLRLLSVLLIGSFSFTAAAFDPEELEHIANIDFLQSIQKQVDQYQNGWVEKTFWRKVEDKDKLEATTNAYLKLATSNFEVDPGDIIIEAPYLSADGLAIENKVWFRVTAVIPGSTWAQVLALRQKALAER